MYPFHANDYPIGTVEISDSSDGSFEAVIHLNDDVTNFLKGTNHGHVQPLPEADGPGKEDAG